MSVPTMFKCTDMALVTFLKLEGFDVQVVDWEDESNSVVWLFDKMPSLMELVEKFHSGQARVEPREYNRYFQLTKREMYSVADHHRQ